MNYFNKISETHTIKFLHRVYEPIITLTIWHELTNNKYDLGLLQCELVDGYSLVHFDFEFILNAKYTIEINSEDKLIYRGKAIAI